MKSVLVLITFIALFLHLTPSAWGNPNRLLINPIPSINNGLGDILSSFLQEFNGLSQEESESSQSDEHFAESIGSLNANFAEEVENYGKILSVGIREYLEKSFSDFLTVVRDIQQSINFYIAQVSNVVKRQALQHAKRALEEFEGSVIRLQAFIEQLRQKIERDVEKGEKAILDAWEDWAKSQLSTVSQRTNQNANILNAAHIAISELINRSGNYLASCGDEFRAQLQVFEDRVQNTINRYTPLVNSLKQEIITCVESKNDIESSEQCRHYIDAGVQELKSARTEFDQLNKDGLQLILSGYRQRSCVVETLRSHNAERIQVELHLRIIMEHGLSNDDSNDSESSNKNVTGNASDSESDSDSDSDNDDSDTDSDDSST